MDKVRGKSDGALPASDRRTIDPQYLLGHENRFDPNVYTPEDLIRKGSLRGRLEDIQETKT